MSGLTKEQFFGAPKRLLEIEVAELSGSVWIRSLTLGERGQVGDIAKKFKDADPSVQNKQFIAKILLFGVCNEDGSRYFAEEDMPKILEIDGVIGERLRSEIMKFSGFPEESRSELEKNSGNLQTGRPSS